MATKKDKTVKSGSKRKIKVNIINQKEVPLQDLIDANLGLYIPLNQLSKDELKLLETFLGDIKAEPSAVAHVASAFVVSARAASEHVASAFVASAFVADADSDDSDSKK